MLSSKSSVHPERSCINEKSLYSLCRRGVGIHPLLETSESRPMEATDCCLAPSDRQSFHEHFYNLLHIADACGKRESRNERRRISSGGDKLTFGAVLDVKLDAKMVTSPSSYSSTTVDSCGFEEQL